MGAARPRLRGWLHGATVPLAVAGLMLLWHGAAELPLLERLPALLYGLAALGLFTTSALYHIPRHTAVARGRLLRLDGAATVLLIVGTFLPVAAYALEGPWRRWSLGAAAVVAVVGVTTATTRLALPPRLAAAGYLLMGWLAAIPLGRMLVVLPSPGVVLLVLGGVLYSLGAVVFARRRPDPFPAWFGFHEVFHVFVSAAAVVHFVAIWRYVLPLAG